MTNELQIIMMVIIYITIHTSPRMPALNYNLILVKTCSFHMKTPYGLLEDSL
jgi:hypothetical protein